MSNNGPSSQQNLPRIRLYDCSFDDNIDFKLFGLMSLIRCEFRVDDVRLILEKSQYEPEVTEETLRHFISNDDKYRIEFIQIIINASDLTIHINNAVRRLKMENVDLEIYFHYEILIGEEGHDFQIVSVFELDVINCRMSASIRPFLILPNSFLKFKFENTVFEQISFYSVYYAGLGSYVFDNCTFIKALRADFQRFLDFKILQSSINVPHVCQDRECDVRLKGVDVYNLGSDRKLSKTFFVVRLFYSLVDIDSSTFQGGHGPFFTICGGTYAGPSIFPRWLPSRPLNNPNYPNPAL